LRGTGATSDVETGVTPLPLGHALSAEELELAEFVDDFALTLLEPLAERCDDSDVLDQELVAIIRSSRLFRYFVPVEHGGVGLSVTALALIRERLAYRSVAADEFFVAQGIPVQPIVLFGSAAQQATFLPPLLEGTSQYAFCLTEPVAGSDVLGIRTTATEVGDAFVLDGVKRYVFGGDTANVLLVFAKTGDPDSRGNISAFLFDRPSSGISARPFPLLAAGPEWELEFDGCVVPRSSLLGERGKGMQIALGNLDRLRPSVGAAAIGMAQRAIDEAAAYVSSRAAFGGTLSDLQGLRFALADAATQIEAARSLVYGAARFADSGAPSRLVRVASAKAKLFATEAAQQAIDAAVQVHGGVGLSRGSITERLYRAVRAMRIYEGASEVMKVVIARSLLDDDRSASR
jgi:acyl-CoA dehydrogenase